MVKITLPLQKIQVQCLVRKQDPSCHTVWPTKKKKKEKRRCVIFPKGRVEKHSRKEGNCTQKHRDFTYKEYLHIRYHVNEDCLRYSRQAIKKILKVVMAMALFFTQHRQKTGLLPRPLGICVWVCICKLNFSCFYYRKYIYY